jgi:hypothetical protein
LALAAVLCVAGGAAVVVYRYARAVDAGEVSPSAAANSWVLTFNHDPDDTAGITRLLVASRRQALLRQRADYINMRRENLTTIQRADTLAELRQIAEEVHGAGSRGW